MINRFSLFSKTTKIKNALSNFPIKKRFFLGVVFVFVVLLVCLFFDINETEENFIDLICIQATVNEYGSTDLVLRNKSSCDLNEATIIFESTGPGSNLNICSKGTQREIVFWKKGDDLCFEFGDTEFLTYALKCKVTILCREGKKEFIFQW